MQGPRELSIQIAAGQVGASKGAIIIYKYSVKLQNNQVSYKVAAFREENVGVGSREKMGVFLFTMGV